MKMEPIKISVEVSVNLSASTQDFIKSLFVATAVKPVEAAKPVDAVKPVEAKPAEPAKPAAPVAPVEAVKPAELAKPVEAKPAAPAEPTKLVEAAKSSVPTVSIEDVRQELVKKVNAHREEIKAKLTEFGAPSVTKLDPSKYEEMYNFLTSL